MQHCFFFSTSFSLRRGAPCKSINEIWISNNYASFLRCPTYVRHNVSFKIFYATSKKKLKCVENFMFWVLCSLIVMSLDRLHAYMVIIIIIVLLFLLYIKKYYLHETKSMKFGLMGKSEETEIVTHPLKKLLFFLCRLQLKCVLNKIKMK